MLKLDGEKGLSTVLTGGHTVREAIQPHPLLPGLWIMPAGPVPPRAADLLSADRMAELLDELSERFEQVVIDSPPVLSVTDATIVSRIVDGVVAGGAERSYFPRRPAANRAHTRRGRRQDSGRNVEQVRPSPAGLLRRRLPLRPLRLLWPWPQRRPKTLRQFSGKVLTRQQEAIRRRRQRSADNQERKGEKLCTDPALLIPPFFVIHFLRVLTVCGEWVFGFSVASKVSFRFVFCREKP